MNYILLIIGFILLIKGSDIFVNGSCSIARKFNISPFIIGVVLAGFATSAPELSVSIQSSIAGMSDMSLSNVIGSNIFNLLVILGASSLFGNLKITKYNDIKLTLAISILLMSVCLCGTINIIGGLVLLTTFVVYVVLLFKQHDNSIIEETTTNNKPLIINICYCIIGLFLIVVGGDLVVDSASIIAISLGMSEQLVGLTIVSIGTSLPELATSISAVRKGEIELAVGNVIGSNIFNSLLIVGAAAIINPLTVSFLSIIDIVFLIMALCYFIATTYKHCIIRKEIGFSMIIIYVIYIIFTIIR
jgi:cation:H+ antiporter